MDIIVSLEAHFLVTPDGRAWSQVGFGERFWDRYLEVFDRVFVMARARQCDEPPAGWFGVTSDEVVLCPVPEYTGPREYFRQRWAVRREIARLLRRECAVIMRVPSQIGTCVHEVLDSRPFGLEVVGDPADVFTAAALQNRLAFAYRWWFVSNLRKQCLRAAGVAYVTRYTLQRRYPSQALSLGLSDVDLPEHALTHGPKGYTTHFSSVELSESHLAPTARATSAPARGLLTIASLAQLYKGTDVLIDAIALCRKADVHLNLIVVGDGKHRQELEERAAALGISDAVNFVGQVTSGAPVRDLIDQADVFVLPSRCEGLPRAMIEAMARGLPCIGSTAGGIPELLSPEDMVPPGDAPALARKIQEVIENPVRLRAMSERNLTTARDYRDSVLAERRRGFYRHIFAETRAFYRKWYERS